MTRRNRIAAIGCLAAGLCGAALTVAIAIAFRPLGTYLGGFALMMLGMAARNESNYERCEGRAVSVSPRTTTSKSVLGHATIEYTASDGVTRTAHKFFDPHLARFKDLRAGDSLVVYVCRRDPRILKLNIADGSECDNAIATTP